MFSLAQAEQKKFLSASAKEKVDNIKPGGIDERNR
jgi:hypothetical protein